jgi:hypothetical protein
MDTFGNGLKCVQWRSELFDYVADSGCSLVTIRRNHGTGIGQESFCRSCKFNLAQWKRRYLERDNHSQNGPDYGD